MRELAVQAGNDTNVAADRVNLQAEVTQLVSEIDRIASQTTWNGMALLDGTFSSKSLQIGPDANQTLTFGVESVASSEIGAYTLNSFAQLSTTTSGGTVATTYDIVGPVGFGTVTTSAGDSAKEFAADVNALSAETGVTASAVTKAKISGLTADDTVSLTINGTAVAATAVVTTDLRDLMSAINAVSGTTGVTASLSGGSNAALELTDADGDDIRLDFETGLNGTEMTLAVLDSSGAAATQNDGSTALSITLIDTGGTAAAGDANEVAITGQVSLNSYAAFNVTTAHDANDYDQTTAGTIVADGEFFGAAGTAGDVVSSASLANISSVDISSSAGANSAINIIDGALDKIAAARADLGAVSNRLDNTVSNLSNVAINVESSRSQIEDADFAAESANLAKQQIMLQAGTAMLAQANAAQQNVLSLLG
jgi:flagellin